MRRVTLLLIKWGVKKGCEEGGVTLPLFKNNVISSGSAFPVTPIMIPVYPVGCVREGV